MTVTYTKLHSGDWGIRIQGHNVAVQEGTVMTVTKKSGEQKKEIVSRVVWSGNGVWLCAIKPTNGTSTHRSANGCSCDCDQCSGHCHCDRTCNCRGGNIYDC